MENAKIIKAKRCQVEPYLTENEFGHIVLVYFNFPLFNQSICHNIFTQYCHIDITEANRITLTLLMDACTTGTEVS